MSCWRLIVDQGKSFLFSGHTSDVQDATLQELKTNPEVVWWHNDATSVPIFFPTSGFDCWVCGTVFHVDSQRHGLFSIKIPSSLHAVFGSLRATNQGLFEETMKLVRGEESQLAGATVTLQWQDRCITFDTAVPALLSRTYDWRFAPRMA